MSSTPPLPLERSNSIILTPPEQSISSPSHATTRCFSPSAGNLNHSYYGSIGSLHGHKCDLEAFFTIDTCVYGFYDLVDGFLIAHDMASHTHQKQIHHLHNGFQENVRAGRVPNNIHAVLNATVAIPEHRSHTSSGASSPSSRSASARSQQRGQQLLVPDLVIGERLSEHQRNALSPRSRNVTFPRGTKIDTIVECTSHNRDRDLKEKPPLFATRGDSQLVIIDNDLPHKSDPSTHKPGVFQGQTTAGEYSLGRLRKGADPVQVNHCGQYTADELLNPPSPSVTVRLQGLKERQEIELEVGKRKCAERKQKLEIGKRKCAEREQKLEVGKRKRAERKLEDARDKARKYKERLIRLGAKVSDSSSSSGSSSSSLILKQPRY